MTKKLLLKNALFLAVLLAGVEMWGQTTIAKQDFEVSAATPVWTYSNTNGAASTTNTGTPAARIRNGSRSFQVNNQAATVTFADVNVSGYTGVKVVVRISSVSTNGTNGADGADYVRAFVKLNSAAFANNTQALADIAVNGDTNARWGYNTTGVTTTAGTNAVVTGTPGTNQGTVYSTLTINVPDGTTTVGLRLNILNNAGEEVWNVDDVEITGTASTPTPTITVSPSSLTGFTYVTGSGPSAQQLFTVEGSNLTGSITVPASSSYELSTTSGGPFSSSSITLTPTSGTVSNTTIYVRLKAGLTAATYNESITITSPSATDKVVSFNGSVTAPVISAALAGTLTEPTLTAGTATATVTLTNDTYAASLTTAGFTLNNAPAGLSLSSVDRTSNTVATLHFTYTGDIDSNVTNFNVTVATSQLTASASALTTGNLTITAVTETLSSNPTTLTGFSYVVGAGPSAAQSLTISSGNNLQAGGGTITITAPSNFEVSTTDATTGFGASASLAYTGTGTISPNQVWVRLKAGLSIGSYSQSVTIAGGKASTSVTVSGSVIPQPPANDECAGATALTLNATAIPGTLENATQSLAAVNCDGNTGNADDDVWYSFTTTAAGDYSITADGGEDLDLVIELRSGACNGISLACMDSTAGGEEVLRETLSASSTYYFRIYEYDVKTSLTNYTFTVKVQKELATPTATAATDITTTGFTANWNTVNDATGYKLYVTTTPGAVTVAEWTFPASPDNATVDAANANNAGRTLTTNATGTISYTSVQSSTTSAASLSGWNAGSDTKYWQVEVNTTNIFGVTLSSAQRSSNTGPADFKVQYRLGTGGTWTDVPDAAITVGNDWIGGALTETALPAACDNKTSVFLRWIMTSNNSVGGSTVASGGTSAIDNISIKGYSYVTGYNGLSVSGTSQAVTGLQPGTTYYYTVVAQGAGVSDSPRSNEITVATGIVNTWNGVSWSAGSAPTMIDEAVINGDYNTATTEDGAFAASVMSVTNGKLTVATGTYITVEGAITVDEDAEMEVQSNASVIQVDEDAVNTGDVVVFRETGLLKRLDYKLWSSPVADQNLLAFTPQTDPARFYIYNTQTNQYNTITASSNDFALGKGYFIRVPNNHPATTPTAWTGKFEGVLYNGAQNVAVEVNTTNSALSFNAIGNPYASPVSADDFIAANSSNIDGTLYFWRKTNNTPADAYATYNTGMGGVTTNPDAPAPNGFIQVGQGFIVNALPTANQVVFNNEMRAANFGNQVFRMNAPAQANSTPAERHRVWVNLTNSQGVFSQTLIGYATGATNGADMGMDSKYLGNNTAALYSVINETAYAIQGRAPFTTNDVVPMGYKAINAGSYTIAIDHMDGVFAEGQAVYLKDNTTGTIHNLSEAAYTFASEAGTFGSRFEIMYTNTVLGTDVPVLSAESIAVYKDGNDIKVNTGTTEMSSVTVYDMRGRQLVNVTGLATTEATISGINAQQQVLIVQVATAAGTVSKKIVF